MNLIFNKKTIIRLLQVLFIVVGLLMASSLYAAPDGFEIGTVTSGLFLPTDFEYAPDGRIFISEKGGTVRIFKDDTLLPTPFLTLSDINDYADHGLIGLALDPDFGTNGYVYLAYVYENDPTNYEGPKTSRVVRVTADGDVMLPGSELILVGTVGGDSLSPSCEDFPAGTDCIASDSGTHTVDALAFGSDGKLYISIGDGADFDIADPLAHRVTDLDKLNGKVLRINSDGTAPTDNPHYDGVSTSNRSKVWASGFRNPFRFSFRPSNDSLYLGDVGWFSFEEINVLTPGLDYGWPCREGFQATVGGYPTGGFTCGTPSSYANPLYAYAHDPETSAGSVTGGMFYMGSSYPSEYQDTYFFGDFALDFIKRIVVDADDNIISVEDFIDGAGGPVAFGPDLSGDVNYLSIYTGELRRLTHTTGNRTPIASISANPTSGNSPLSVFFSSVGSSDPDGDPITFLWDFGDTTTSTLSNVNHSLASDGVYDVTLTVTDDGGKFDIETKTITVGNNAPSAIIASPENGYLYTPLETISLHGVGLDEEDGEITADTQFSWRVLLHHNIHYHVFQEMTGKSPDILAPDHGSSDVYIEIQLTVTDSGGLKNTKSIYMYVDDGSSPDPFHVDTEILPLELTAGTPLTITTTIDNAGDPLPFLIDIELYNSLGMVAQSFYDSEIVTAGIPREFTLDYTPTVGGNYRVAVGLIHEGWQGLYEWTNEALLFTVAGGATNTPPTITLLGANPLNLNVGDTYTDDGATASDTEDGDLTASIVVGGDTVDTATVGTYNVTYDVTDSGSLVAPTETRVVNVTNSGSWVPIPPNGGTYFDGIDDYINTEFWDIEEPIGFTLESRFAADSFNGDTIFIGKAVGTSTPDIDFMFGLRETSSTTAELLFTIKAGGIVTELTGGSVSLGEFVHASAVYDNIDMKIYKDGVEVASIPKTGLIATDITHSVWLGNLPDDPTTNAFHGTFDEIRVWNEPQSAQEIIDFQGELTQKELGLIKDWRFNEGFGQVAIDKSNSGHHGHLGSVEGASDSNDPTFLGGIYSPGGSFDPTHVSTIASPNPVTEGVPTTITTTIDNVGDGSGFMIVDIEIYDEGEVQVFQNIFDGEGFHPGQSRDFEVEWTPATEGTYRVETGLAHLFWDDIYEWVGDAETIIVTAAGTNTPPTITLLGANPLNLNVGDTYTDPGATASDTEDGDLTASIVVGGDTVDTATVGTYNVTYDVTDSGSLVAPTETRVVNVSDVSGPFNPVHTSSIPDIDPSLTGDTVTITTTITNTGSAGSMLVDLELYDEGIQVAQEIYDNEFFEAGESRDFTIAYTTAHEGEYGLAVGLFDEGWASLYTWLSHTVGITAYDTLPDENDPDFVYKDALQPGFSSWSWDTTIDFASTAVTPSEGIRSIEASFTSPWGGLYIRRAGYSTTGKSDIYFDVNGGPTGGQSLQIIALDGAGSIVGQVPFSSYIGDIINDSWSSLVIPLADLNIADTTIVGLIIQGTTGAIEPTFYIDNFYIQ
jgi:glucose/arabinose dehydrogenase/PKD repeat protein